MEYLVACVESCAIDVSVVDRSAACTDEASPDILKTSTGCIRIAGWLISNALVSAKQLDWSIGVFGDQHYAGVIGERSGENLRQDRGQRVAGKPNRHGVLDVAANCVERKRAASQIGDVRAELKLIGARRSVVQTVAAKLPERRYPELANLIPILHRRAKSAIFGIAHAAGDSLPAQRRESVRRPHRIVGEYSVQRQRVLAEHGQGSIG